MINRALQFAAAFLLIWFGCRLAAFAGVPIIGQDLIDSGVQVAMSHAGSDQAKGSPESAPTEPKTSASAWGLQVHVTSVPMEPRPGGKWNQGNDGFALRYAFNETYAVQAGHYRNEHSTPGFNVFTNYLFLDYTPFRRGPLSLGAFGGAVSGFDECTVSDNKVVGFTEVGVAPKFGLLGRYQWRAFSHDLNATLRASPAQRRAGPASIGVELGFLF